MLEATALAEKPLLDAAGVATVDAGLDLLHFHYYFLLVLLTVSSREMRTQSAAPAQQMLAMLPKIGDRISDFKEPYVSLIWQAVHYPMAAFGTLWGEVVTKRKSQLEKSKKSLQAIGHLPPFLRRLSSRNPLIPQLESIVGRIVEHAGTILYSQGKCSL